MADLEQLLKGPQATLSDILDRLVLIGQSVMDSGAPMETDGPLGRPTCYLCCVEVQETGSHDPDCGWRVARELAYADIEAVRRLARALRYAREDRR